MKAKTVDKTIEKHKKKLGKKISDLRGKMSQRELAKQIGLPNSNLKYIEDGINAPTHEVYAAIIKVLSPGPKDQKEMDRLLSIADSYGTGKADIYCTFEFAATMVPAQGWISDAMRDQKWNNGYLANYKGHRVIVLAQSYEDETNTTKIIDPQYAWVVPGGAAKPVKIAFEGQTIVDEYTNYDRSKEVQVYKKVGVRAVFTNDICVYQNTSLKR